MYTTFFPNYRVVRVAILIVQFLLGLAFAALHVLWAWQAVCLARENTVYKAPGEMISLSHLSEDVDYLLHFRCMGEKKNADDPIIWMEHGLGGQMLDFSKYMENLTSIARVCSYDHAGLGWSGLPVYLRQFLSFRRIPELQRRL